MGELVSGTVVADSQRLFARQRFRHVGRHAVAGAAGYRQLAVAEDAQLPTVSCYGFGGRISSVLYPLDLSVPKATPFSFEDFPRNPLLLTIRISSSSLSDLYLSFSCLISFAFSLREFATFVPASLAI